MTVPPLSQGIIASASGVVLDGNARPVMDGGLQPPVAGEAADHARMVERICRDSGATEVRVALDKPTETELWELRHAASPILARLDPSLRSMQFIEDGVVPVARLADYIRLLRSTLAKHALPAVIFGHAGDGNLHVNPLVDVRTAGWKRTIEAVTAPLGRLTTRTRFADCPAT